MKKSRTKRKETIHEAEMRGLATLGIGPMVDLALSAVEDFKVAFGRAPRVPQADGKPSSKEPEK